MVEPNNDVIKKIEEDVLRKRDEERSKIEAELRSKIEAEIAEKAAIEAARQRDEQEKKAVMEKLSALEEQNRKIAEELASRTSSKRGMVMNDSPFKDDKPNGIDSKQLNPVEVERASEQAFLNYLDSSRRPFGKSFK